MASGGGATAGGSANGSPANDPRGNIVSVQRFCLHDGPGIRSTVFFQGCPLDCPWCHNPESRRTGSRVWVRESRCIECGACAEVCPVDVAADLRAGSPRMAEAVERCVHCGACLEACPTGARQDLRREVGVAELVDEVGRDVEFFVQSGGGVTFSGGEPLLQAVFLNACLDECRTRGLHTAVDTCLHAPETIVRDMARRCDLVLADLKLADPERHRRAVGVSSELILANLRVLSGLGTSVWLRLPLVPGVNDDEENLRATAEIAASLDGVRRLHVLPYHELGSGKRRRLGRKDPCADTKPADEKRLAEVAELLRTDGLEVHLGG